MTHTRWRRPGASATTFIASGRLEGDRPGIGCAPVRIGDHCCIRTSALVLTGVRIGPGTVVAAGSVAVSDLPPFTVAAGNPARVVRSVGSSPVRPGLAR